MLLAMTPPPDIPAVKKGSVLVVDDEEAIVWALQKVVESMGLQVASASSAERALEASRTRPPDVILMDVKLPGMDGLKAVEEFKRVAPSAKVIVMTAHGSLETAVKALKLGALEYLPKPFDLAQVKVLLEAALRDVPGDASIQSLRRKGPAPGGIVGRSPAMQELFKQVAAVAASDTSVLLIGESGTGKELISRAIHHNSGRASGPFEAINCASIPETLLESELYGHERGAFTGAEREKLGKLEIAHGGTVFLDEVGDLPLAAQVKLLRFIEDRKLCHVGGTQMVPVDVRIVSATNQDLETKIAEGLFREDLYFRLNVVKIVVPPLRERKDDLPLLVAHYLDHEQAAGITTSALDVLKVHSWPGNVRELRNTIERGVVLARRGIVKPEHLPESVRSPVLTAETDVDAGIRRLVDRLVSEAVRGDVFRQVESRWEKALLRRILDLTKGNQLKAAEMLGITRTTVKRKMDLYGL
jgi:DNA-binding NtrC family response regulator